MRPGLAVATEDSIERAIAELRRSGNGLVPIVSDDRVVGVLTEYSAGAALGEGVDTLEPVSSISRETPLIRSYMTGAEALRLFEQLNTSTLVVVDDQDRLMGLLSPSDLYPRRLFPPRPSSVGGMATPFGVYLTNGAIGAGASNFALMTTGFLMFAMMTVGQIVAYFLLVQFLSDQSPQWLVDGLSATIPLGIFLLLMRLLPLSGTHAAEHMVVHAIERGEELHPDIVRRMPRVHPRCGTNLAVGAGIFCGILSIPGVDFQILLIPAFLVTMYSWRRLGSIAQSVITTKTPNEKQLQSGLKAGNDLLEKFSKSSVTVPSVPVRFWRSGLLQVMMGSMTCFGVVTGIEWVLNHFWNLGISL
ncbi:hypothetical protein BH11ARM1_BH11ARM1_01490 [soil metagenome]